MSETAMILVIEDEELLRRTFSHQLEDAGYVTYCVNSFENAVAELEKNRYDVIVSDIMLGQQTGVDVLEWMRVHGDESPVILVTGHPDVSTASNAIRFQAFEYLLKPVQQEKLVRTVQHAVSFVRLKGEKLRLTNELNAIFDTMTEAVFTVDTRLNITRMNKAFCALFELDENSTKRRSIDGLQVDGFDEVSKLLGTVIRDGSIVENANLELRVKSGKSVFVSANIAPLSSFYPETNAALVVFRDKTRLHKLQNRVLGSKRMGDLVGNSPAMLSLFQSIEDVAETDTTVLITGETGTGKEVVANTIHQYSNRSNRPFVAINCAVFSEGLLESELFGHVRGAFTNAHSSRKGRFEAANGGTVFLDEIGDLPPHMQLKLLRVLQERKIERVGDNHSIHLDVRILAATHRDLKKHIQQGKFREDLYYRLNVVQINVPPLRDRIEDVPLLAEHFRNQLNRAMHKSIDIIPDKTLDLLKNNHWTGNVREFINVLERAFIGCHENILRPNHIPREIVVENQVLFNSEELTEETEIRELLVRTDWNIAKTARILGIARNTLYRKIRKYSISLGQI